MLPEINVGQDIQWNTVNGPKTGKVLSVESPREGLLSVLVQFRQGAVLLSYRDENYKNKR